MIHNVGEEIAGAYLKNIKKCNFIDYNIRTTDTQGEIDVIGVDVKYKKVYICEVAIHLTTGLQYTKNGRPNNTKKLIEKFDKGIKYGSNQFKGYKKIYMLWSPVVKNQRKSASYNQLDSILSVEKYLNKKHRIKLELIINDEFQKCLDKLKEYSSKQSKELNTPILRLMQIEEKLKKHLNRKVSKI